MKIKILILSLTFIHCLSYGQDTSHVPTLPLQTNEIVYYDTVVLDSTYKKDILFNNAHKWYDHNFETSDDKLTIDNSYAGIISGPASLNFKKHKDDQKDLLFTIDVIAANGYYVYKIYKFYGYENGMNFNYSEMYHEELYPIPKPEWSKEIRYYKLSNLDTCIHQTISDLHSALTRR